MKEIIKNVIFIFRSLFFIPHYVLYFFSKNKTIIREDVEAMSRNPSYSYKGTKLLFYLLINDRYFRTMFYTRLGIVSHLLRWYAPASNMFFPCDAIGGGVYLAHPYATIINAKRVGKMFTCRQCTTIGNKKDGDASNLPVIGDNVTLGANVVIIGNVYIGNNVIVGAGSVVVKDVPDNCIVAGNPAKLIRKL